MHAGQSQPSHGDEGLRPHPAGGRGHRSSLEGAAAGAGRVRPGRPAVLAALILAGLPRRAGEDDVLWPLWASEAVCRAEGLLGLLARLDRSRRGGSDRLGRRMDVELARDLAAQYRLVQAAPARTLVPCSPVLRDTAAAVVSLFGDVAGGVVLRTDVARLVLPGFQRRALVLAAATLVIGALSRGGAVCGAGPVTITLRHCHLARLCVAAPSPVGWNDPHVVAAHGMAELLEGRLRLCDEGRQAEILFPLPPSHPRH